jgi:uncharacterized protein
MPRHPALTRLDHRPWPIPGRRWIWRQSWCDLLFAHWPAPPATLQELVPPPLVVQEFEGTSWVGVVPFRMADVSRRPLPVLPYVSGFPELNVRLYVEYRGRPGVWFLSLDAASRLAVWFARRFFHLPYFRARMSAEQVASTTRYSSLRLDEPAGAAFEATYAPAGPVRETRPGSLEHWLTERYCLYAKSPKGDLFRTEVHHHPWPLAKAEASISRNDLLSIYGLGAGPPALTHFSRRVDVVTWAPQRLA